ncbi:MAG: AraC family transcriptional regulator [Tissierellia bacterium]|nr:AraC family transcriptional regulator [Tissierellia bacterium]
MREIDPNNFFVSESSDQENNYDKKYLIRSSYGDGFQHIYNIDDNFYVSIYNIKFKKEFILRYTLPDRYVLVLYITGSGNEFYPYQNISPNTLRCYEPREKYKVIYHPQIELKSISIEFTADFIESFLKKRYRDIDIAFSNFFRNKNKLFLPKINKLMYEIYKCNGKSATTKLLLESKVYEVLTLIAYYLENEGESLLKSKSISEKDIQLLQEITKYIDEHYNFNISLQTLSKIACMSESKMKKIFKIIYNMSITEYIQRKRMSVAEHLLISTSLSINEISTVVGYSNPSRLTELFKRYYGSNPSNYR